MIDAIAFVVALVLVSYLHVVFGEMVPKNLAFSMPDRAVLILATPLVWCSRLFHPVIVALNWTANHFVRLFRVEPKDEAASTFTLDEVATIVATSREEGVLDDAAGTVAAVVEFTDKKAGEIAVPFAELVTLPQTATADEIERAVARHGYSRYVITDAARRAPRIRAPQGRAARRPGGGCRRAERDPRDAHPRHGAAGGDRRTSRMPSRSCVATAVTSVRCGMRRGSRRACSSWRT